MRKISTERKLDILGVLLLIVGVISLIGFFSGGQTGLAAGINRLLGWIAGMGAILFPLVLVFLGLWFLVRNEQRIPMLSAERMLGVVFLYLNILSWMHWFSGGGWDLAKLGQGGGYIGGFFERLLVVALGDSGAAVVLVAWLLVSLAFTFDLSIPDLFRKLTSPAVKTGEFIAEKSSKIAQPLTEKMEGESSKPAIVFKEGNTHPQGFTPIGGKRVKKNGAGKDAAAQPDQAGGARDVLERQADGANLPIIREQHRLGASGL